ncbi:MAG TPA: imidazole glycerol phosphate synthase subunit HisH [Lachnospiraceae bacterium]|nr:imidazole glycerol phosphate synthase subunit HisH [Lachnospiraceae bacterium]
MIAICDYDAGNIMSVQKAVSYLGHACVLTRDRQQILQSDHVILPGVGSFGDAMNRLSEYGLDEVLKETVQRGIPLLGICLGLQLMFEDSEESPGYHGLGLFSGSIVKIPDHGGALKIPHMGWNSLSFPSEGKLFRGIPEGTDVYFVHSYYLPVNPDVKAVTEYGTMIGASVEKDHVFACQFHPEKSGKWGLKILENFLKL